MFQMPWECRWPIRREESATSWTHKKSPSNGFCNHPSISNALNTSKQCSTRPSSLESSAGLGSAARRPTRRSAHIHKVVGRCLCTGEAIYSKTNKSTRSSQRPQKIMRQWVFSRTTSPPVPFWRISSWRSMAWCIRAFTKGRRGRFFPGAKSVRLMRDESRTKLRRLLAAMILNSSVGNMMILIRNTMRTG